MKGACVPTKGLFGPVKSWQTGDVFLKRHVRRKNGKEHVYYSLAESIRVSGSRTIQRRVLNLGELNTTQIEGWQRSIEVIEKEGQSRQYRLFTDREGGAPANAADVCEVILSSLAVLSPYWHLTPSQIPLGAIFRLSSLVMPNKLSGSLPAVLLFLTE